MLSGVGQTGWYHVHFRRLIYQFISVGSGLMVRRLTVLELITGTNRCMRKVAETSSSLLALGSWLQVSVS